MSPDDRKALKAKIKKLIKKLDAEIIDLQELTKPISPENSLGRISRMDAINNKSVAEAALRSKKNKVGKMRVALTKIDDENFGTCFNCGLKIQAGRLILMPESNKCVRCASR